MRQGGLSYTSRMKIPTVALLALLPVSSAAFAQEVAPATPPAAAEKLPEVTITGRADSLVGIADSASQGSVGRDHLDYRPLLQPGEILETVPGLVITQHSGSGKANQYYLRGFDLDHGTDFATTVDGMPVNMPTHAHGQGYSDLNFIIPELVERVDFKKGPYFADTGDFSSAGSANLHLSNELKQGFATVEAGSWGRLRELFADSFLLDEANHGTLLIGTEHLHDNGPWDKPQDYEKYNATVRYSAGDADSGWSVTGMGYHGAWNATNQIPQRAIDQGLISPFGSIDPSDLGNSQRYSLQGEVHQRTDEAEFKANAYVFYYDMRLVNNFTFFMDNPVNGDQFQQKDRRMVEGLNASQLFRTQAGGIRMENLVGLQLRSDQIDNSLFHTVNAVPTSQIRNDSVWQTSGALYFQNTCFFGDHFRTMAGLRGDLFNFDVDDALAANSGNRTAGIISPKLGLVVGPWADTEFYANAGMGYHSNDARGVTTTVDPGNGSALPSADPLVRTYGGEIGARTTAVKGLQSTLSLWVLQSDSELLFAGDDGTTGPTGPSRRYGVEWSNYYAMNRWLTFDADVSLSQARYLHSDESDDITTGTEVPGSIQSVVTGGITLHDFHGFFGGLHARYFGPRPLTNDGSVMSQEALMVNLSAGYQFNSNWKLTGEVFNLLNRKDQDAAYYYPSQLKGEAAPVNDVVFHPTEPMSFRLSVTGMF